MLCSRCGETAVVQRGAVYYCGRCALTRDWEEIVRIVQQLDAPMTPAPERAASHEKPAVPADPFAA
jgi:hypothetical protein